MLWCDICHLKDLLVCEGVMSDQGDPVSANTVTYGAGIWLTVREDLIENLVIVRQDVVLEIGLVFTDLAAFETHWTTVTLRSLDCALRSIRLRIIMFVRRIRVIS